MANVHIHRHRHTSVGLLFSITIFFYSNSASIVKILYPENGRTFEIVLFLLRPSQATLSIIRKLYIRL